MPVRPIEMTWPFFALAEPWVNRKMTKAPSVTENGEER